MQLKVDEPAPLFESTADDGKKFSLSDLLGKSNIILYFYPKDFTPGCTKEARSFRDNWDKILASDATVVGISSDSSERHSEFKRECNLPFTLLADQDKSIRKLYGVAGSLLPPRVTFVIDKSGKIKNIFNSQLNVTRHIKEALTTIEKMSTEVKN